MPVLLLGGVAGAQTMTAAMVAVQERAKRQHTGARFHRAKNSAKPTSRNAPMTSGPACRPVIAGSICTCAAPLVGVLLGKYTARQSRPVQS
jgi:hypothetical protein